MEPRQFARCQARVTAAGGEHLVYGRIVRADFDTHQRCRGTRPALAIVKYGPLPEAAEVTATGHTAPKLPILALGEFHIKSADFPDDVGAQRDRAAIDNGIAAEKLRQSRAGAETGPVTGFLAPYQRTLLVDLVVPADDRHNVRLSFTSLDKSLQRIDSHDIVAIDKYDQRCMNEFETDVPGSAHAETIALDDGQAWIAGKGSDDLAGSVGGTVEDDNQLEIPA